MRQLNAQPTANDTTLPLSQGQHKKRYEPTSTADGIVESDDFISPLNIETYVEYRAKPLTTAFESQTPSISRLLSSLEILTFLLTSAGAVLAVPGIDAGSWVAITVAMSTAVTSYIEYFQLRVERDTRNNSLSEFQNMLTWWDSLSIIDKRTKSAKEKALGTIENGSLMLVERRAGAAFQRSGDDKDNDDSDANEKQD